MHNQDPLTPLLKVIGEKLRQQRTTRNEKLLTIERALGISHGTISKIENGRYNCLTLMMLTKISGYYQVEVSELLTNAQKP